MKKPLPLKWFFYVARGLMPTTSILLMMLSHLESSLYKPFLLLFNLCLPYTIDNIFNGWVKYF